MIELLKQEGHTITSREIVPDDSKLIREKVIAGCENPDVDVILTNGGTGISFRDVTIETIDNILDKEIPGFGELFRVLSYQEDIGSSAIMSRAIAGEIGRASCRDRERLSVGAVVCLDEVG